MSSSVARTDTVAVLPAPAGPGKLTTQIAEDLWRSNLILQYKEQILRKKRRENIIIIKKYDDKKIEFHI